MNDQKTLIRFFTIADYEEEEAFLRKQHNLGWKLKKTVPPCFFVFEKCAPEDVVYRLDYKNNTETGDYFQMFQDYGWERCGQCLGWLYFRKPASAMDSEQEGEIFSDDASRLAMVDHILKTRMLPLVIVFLCCLLPNFSRLLNDSGDPMHWFLLVLFSALMLLYIFLFLHCGRKLRRLRRRYARE